MDYILSLVQANFLLPWKRFDKQYIYIFSRLKNQNLIFCIGLLRSTVIKIFIYIYVCITIYIQVHHKLPTWSHNYLWKVTFPSKTGFFFTTMNTAVLCIPESVHVETVQLKQLKITIIYILETRRKPNKTIFHNIYHYIYL